MAAAVSAGAPIEAREATVDGLLGPISLSIAEGERVALLGRNGGGKSTFLRLVAGLLSPTTGSVLTRGDRGYVPQSFGASLLPWLSVRHNVSLPLRSLRLSAAEVSQRIARALEIVPLDPALLTRRPDALSGGEQQLVALARAVVGDPPLLLLDEPFSALDAIARKTLRASLATLRGRTLLVVSHDLDDLALVDRAIVLAAGRVVADVAAARAREALDAQA